MLIAVTAGDLLNDYGPPAIRVIAILVATKIAATIVLRFVDRVPEKFQRQARYLIPKVIWALGLIILLGAVGIDIDSLIAVFGVVGLAAALVFTPVGQSAIAGFLAGIDNVVQVDDVINVLDQPGKVVRKGTLSLGVELLDGSVVYVPNTKAVDDELINYSRSGASRIEVEIKLDGDPDLSEAIALMRSTLDSLDWQLEDRPAEIYFAEIGGDAFHYRCCVWIGDKMDGEQYESDMLQALVDTLRGEGFSVGETGSFFWEEFPDTARSRPMSIPAPKSA